MRWLICEWLSWALRMSRPGDETKVGSRRHREHNQRLRQLASSKAGHPSHSLVANVRDTSTTNGVTAGTRRPASATVVLPARGATPTFLCRCPDATAVEEAPVPASAPVRRRHPQCCAAVESLRPELAAILVEVKCITRKMRDDEWNDDQTSDWKFAAMVIDRLSFWVLTLYLVVVTLAVFCSPLPRS